MSFVIAGRDTTAACLTWCFYEMGNHPEVRDKLVNEIDNAVGKADPTYADVHGNLPFVHVRLTLNMQFVLIRGQATIKETLRLYPSVPKVLLCESIVRADIYD